MQSSRSLGRSPSSLSVQGTGGLGLSGEFALLNGTKAVASAPSASRRALRGPRLIRALQGADDGSPLKRLRAPEERNPAGSAAASSDTGREGEDEGRRRVLQQLSQVLPAAGSLLPAKGGPSLPDEGALGASVRAPPVSASSEILAWHVCNRALDRLVGGPPKSKEPVSLSLELGSRSSSNGEMGGLFDLPVGEARSNNDLIGGDDLSNEFFHVSSESPLGGLAESTQSPGLLSLKCSSKTSSKAADPMKERQRRELQQKKTFDLAAQIVSRFRGARRPGVLQLLHRFFSCSTKRQVRDPEELEKLVGACCYIIARQQGDDMSLNDVTAQLERRQGSKGRQRCRCISKWVVKVCGRLQLRCLPRRRDVEAMASSALRRICCHLKLLLTQQEQQELLLLHHLKEAYRQCLQQEAASCHGSGASSSNNSNNQQQDQGRGGGDTGLADLDDEELLRLLLIQQQEESAAAVGCGISKETEDEAKTPATGAAISGPATASTDGLPDVDDFLKQFDMECKAAKPTQLGDEELRCHGAADIGIADTSEMLRGSFLFNKNSNEKQPLMNPSLTGEEEAAGDPATLDMQIQQHECVLRLLRLLPSAQRIKLDHSIWLQRQRKLALQQLCEQSSLVIRCVGLLQQLTAVAFASAAAKKGCQSTAILRAAEITGDEETADRQTVAGEEEDPLNDKWRACGRCDAISTAAHFVIVLECLQVPVFQRVVLEALEVDRRSVYKRRREQLHFILNIFRRLPGAENVTAKTLGPHLISAVDDPKRSEELLQIAETETFPSVTEGSGGALSEEKQSNTSIPTSSNLTSQTFSHSSREDSSVRGMQSTRGSSPVAGSQGIDTPSSAAAAAAALRELEEGDPVLSETPMARVVSLQYERTQQRWVCKWREGVGTGGRWHRRCFSVVKYGEDGAHTLAAAVAKKLRDKRSQETGGTKSSGIPVCEGTSGGGYDSTSNAFSKRSVRASPPREESDFMENPYPRPGGGATAKPRNKRSAATAGGGATASSHVTGSSYSFVEGSESQSEPLLATLPADPALSSVVASAAYSDEMDRLAQLLHKARSNPLLAKWLDERAPPPGAAALRAAAERLVPYLALQTAADNKTLPGGAAPFGAQQQPPHRRGRVAGAREGM